MGRFLITKSLLSSWGYTFDCMEGKEEEAYEDFLHALRREETPTPEAAQAGIDFENTVYSVAAGQPTVIRPGWEDGVRKLSAILRGAQVQVRVQRDIQVDGVDYLVYGVLDAIKAGVIYDVKYKSKSFSQLELAGSYRDNPQHPAYLYMVPGAREFQYLVSDGEDLYIEKYTPAETRPIGEIIRDFIRSISGMGLLDEYQQHWEAKERELRWARTG